MKKNWVGLRFGRLTVLEVLPERPNKNALLLCKCDCGVIKNVQGPALNSSSTKSCGCLKRERHLARVEEMRLDLNGRVFGELTVVEQLEGDRWLCKCTCGSQKSYRAGALNSNTTNSCGCKRREKFNKAIKDHVNKDRVNGTRKTALTSKIHKNNKTGYKGVCYLKNRGKYQATIGFQGKSIKLGTYSKLEDAVEARRLGEEKYYAPILNAEDE